MYTISVTFTRKKQYTLLMVISVSDELYVLATSTNTKLYFCTSCGTCCIRGYLRFHLGQHPRLDQTTEILNISDCPP